MDFVHLHNHTEYSLLDGLSRIPQLVARAKELGMSALAITDHGSLHGAVEFYQECRAVGIKPILGCESYVAINSRHIKNASEKTPHHLTILAKNTKGYENLLELVTKAHLEGFYYRPRVDKELLEQHHKGLVVLSGCPSAEIPKLLIAGEREAALEAALWYRDTFEDFFIELQWHEQLPFLKDLNEDLIDLSKKLNIPLVITNDSHYVHRDESELQDILICIHTNTTIADEKRLKMDDDSYYLRPAEEMTALFPNLPDALENTRHIADMCNVELDFSTLHLPQFPIPNESTADEYLEFLCRENLLHKQEVQLSAESETRLKYELDVIREAQLANYFLVVWDIAAFARDQGILFGVRGSAAGSIVLYYLGVTEINPQDYTLVFERFLNRERKEMPDIDMDFQDDRRDEVIDYVLHKYGQAHVAQIITFGTLGAKAALRDVGRALAIPYAEVDRVAKLIPTGSLRTEQGEVKPWALGEAIIRIPEFKQVYEEDESLRNLINTARRLEGITRHASTHAAGVVISEEPLTRYVPLQRPVKGDESGIAMTQFSMGPIATLGLLKMDFLGLTNLTILSKTRDLITATKNPEFTLNSIRLDDPATFELLASGETTSLFQLESTGMRRSIKDLKPTSLGDLAAMIALYRPGPMEHIDTYIQAKHGQNAIQYPHPALENILSETYGVIVYQDQVLLVLQAVAGYSLGEADIVRKAMGKKIADLMRQERQRFLAGAKTRGFTEQVAEEVFDLIEPFAGYAFNKAHAVSYALVAYWTAYLKANYPVEYMTAILNSYLGNTDKTATVITECRRLRIPVLSPNLNHSDVDFRVEAHNDGGPAIRFGLGAIKNVGSGTMKTLLNSIQQHGPINSLEDFCRRSDPLILNRRTLESLIRTGVLDVLGIDRGTLLANTNRILSMAQQEARLQQSGQSTMFDLFGETVASPFDKIELEAAPASSQEKLTWEKELLGVYVSQNPLALLGAANKTSDIVTRADLNTSMNGRQISIVGQVSGCRKLLTKEGKAFAIITFEFLDGNVEVVVWPQVYARNPNLWTEGTFVQAVGKVRVRDEEVSIICIDAHLYSLEESLDKSQPPSSIPPDPSRPVENNTHQTRENQPARVGQHLWLRIQETDRPSDDGHLLSQVIRTLLDYPGDDVVRLKIVTSRRNVQVEMEHIRIGYCANLHDRLEELLGTKAISLQPSDSTPESARTNDQLQVPL